MSDYKDQKEMKMAMNGRMGLMTGGMILVFTAVSSTLMYGINLMSIASGAAGGNEEYLELLSAAGMGLTMLRIVAVCFFVLAAAEAGAGILCILRCNRLDQANTTKLIIIALLAVEVVMQIFLTATRMLNLASLFTSLLIPLYMLWGATRLIKLAKLYPDRKFALDTKKAREQRQAAAKPAPKKSLHERAMMNTPLPDDDDTSTASVERDASDATEDAAAESTEAKETAAPAETTQAAQTAAPAETTQAAQTAAPAETAETAKQ